MLLAGCGGGSGSSAPTTTEKPSVDQPTTTTAQQGSATGTPATTATTAATTATTAAPTATTVASASAGVNKWFPLDPGLQSVREGRLNRGHRSLTHRRVFTVTNVTKEIDGKRAVLVLDQDYDGGEIAEAALDYLSVDAKGNVLYLGSYTESYEGGQFVNAADAWLAGVKGSAVGVLVPGDLRVGTASFVQVDVPGKERSTAKVIKTGQKACVPFKCFEDVVVIQEGNEYKYLAPGVGDIKTEPHYSGGEQEIEELVNLAPLSAQGLTEISAEALRLDQHASQTTPKVFGSSKPAEQAR